MTEEEEKRMSLIKKILIVSTVAIILSGVTIHFIWAELYKCQSGLREITAEIMVEVNKPGQISPLMQKYFEDK